MTDGSIVIGTSVDVGGINTGLNKVSNAFKRFGKTVGASLNIGSLAQFGKAAIEAASDLQEVQNIVDVSFGDMEYKIEQFAKISIDRFGVSEFAAKQTAGSFMAMGNALGLTREEASDMSVRLTALTGDFASFYNISQEYARVALSAIYTGETETLKRYGIILTEANLQEYASTIGIQQKVKAMGARDKAILRYMYVMQQTQQVQGDFMRTEDNWANQLRVLTERWKQLFITIGNGLIKVLSPLLKVLNAIIARLIQFVKVVGVILARLFGIDLSTPEEELSGIGDSAGDAAEGMDDFGDSTAAAAKKAKKSLAPFDDLNNILTTTGSDVGGLGGGAGLGLDIDLSDLLDAQDAIEDITSDIDNWYDFGKFIGDKLVGLLQSIDWDSIYEGARNFGTNLAAFLNGLISTDLFKEVGKTIASALNTAIYAALAFGTEFDWAQLGQKIADGINEFFLTFDFAAFGQTINTFVQGILTTIRELIANVDWSQVWTGIKTFFAQLDPDTIYTLVGFFILKSLFSKALRKLFASVFSLKFLSRLIAKQLGKGAGSGVGKTLGSKLVDWFKVAFEFLVKTLPKAIAGFVSNIGSVISNVLNGVPLASSNGSLGAFDLVFGEGAAATTGIVSMIGGAILAVAEFIQMWQKGWSLIREVLKDIGIAIAAVGAVLAGIVTGPVAAIIAAIVAAVSTIVILVKEHWDTISAFLSTIGTWIYEHIITPVINFFKLIVDVFTPIVSWCWDHILSPIINLIVGFVTRAIQVLYGTWILLKAYFIVAYDFVKTKIIDPIMNIISIFVDWIVDIATKIWGVISEKFLQFVAYFKNCTEFSVNLFTKAWDKIKQVWSVVAKWFSDKVITPVQNAWDKSIKAIAGFFDWLWTGITTGVKGAINGLLGAIETGLNWIVDMLNKFLGGFNSVVQLAATVTGNDWGGVSLIPRVSIPKLAKGAVIPANNPFMAILGDQKNGTNIEAPLSTIEDALRNVLKAENINVNVEFDVQGDPNNIFRVVRKEANQFAKRTGNPAFI